MSITNVVGFPKIIQNMSKSVERVFLMVVLVTFGFLMIFDIVPWISTFSKNVLDLDLFLYIN